MSLDIFVVAYRAKQDLVQTLGTIAFFSKPGYRLTIYENAEKNYPLTWLWNQFVRASQRPFIAICNPDILVGPGWDTEAIACLEDNAVGAVNPLSNYGMHYHALAAKKDLFSGGIDIPNMEMKTEELKKEFSDRRFTFGDQANFLWGHCYIFRRQVWENLGGFDERFEFGGNEYEFSTRLVKAGLKLGLCAHAFAYHSGNKSSAEARAHGVWDAGRNQPRFNKPPSGVKFGDI
jgi:GT2 family glycosyltransferase